jgi:3-dehydroquinate dehydratase/shikimate dehydrogenase
MQVGPSYESFKAFMAEVQARPWLDFRGFSVTIPHKENAVRFLREVGGELDPWAARAGAVNTLTLAPEGRLAGHNTDGTAAIQAICAGLNCPKGKLGGLQVAVLGAGGVSRAIVGGLTEAGSRITVFNRTEEKAKRLAEAFGCRHLPWDERVRADAGLVVNCTSVGLWPNVDASPMPAEALKGGTAVFDTVYNPLRTRLLREASEHGCTTIDGMGMFVLQAEAQFRLWTGRDPAPEVFRQAAESRP